MIESRFLSAYAISEKWGILSFEVLDKFYVWAVEVIDQPAPKYWDAIPSIGPFIYSKGPVFLLKF